MYKIVSALLAMIMSICSFLGIDYERPAFMLDSEKLAKTITESQNNRLADNKIAGSLVMINQNGKTVFSGSFGKTGVDGEDITFDNTFRIASMTKPIAAAALLIAYDQGIVDIYKNVEDYLPQFSDMYLVKTDDDGNPLKDEAGNLIKGEKAQNKIKVYQTVSHVTGLQEVTIDSAKRDTYTIKDAVDYIASQPLNFEPGTSQAYCTSSFDIAARIIEIQSGMEFEQYLKTYIFSKLGMTDTTFEPTEAQFERMVDIFGRNDDGTVYNAKTNPGCVFGSFPCCYHAAGAALMSTISDYMKFAEMLQNNGKAPDGTVVMSEKAVKLMQTPIPEMATISKGDNQQWGLGVRVIANNRYTHGLPMGAFGWSGAYGTHFWIDPVNKITAVYMKNAAYDGGAGAATANELEEDVTASMTLKKVQ